MHRREITYEREPRVLTVTDQILSASVHHIEILWHFAQECVVTLEGETARATRNGVELRLQWPVSLQAQLVRGSTDPAQGWISDRVRREGAGRHAGRLREGARRMARGKHPHNIVRVKLQLQLGGRGARTAVLNQPGRLTRVGARSAAADAQRSPKIGEGTSTSGGRCRASSGSVIRPPRRARSSAPAPAD